MSTTRTTPSQPGATAAAGGGVGALVVKSLAAFLAFLVVLVASSIRLTGRVEAAVPEQPSLLSPAVEGILRLLLTLAAVYLLQVKWHKRPWRDIGLAVDAGALARLGSGCLVAMGANLAVVLALWGLGAASFEGLGLPHMGGWSEGVGLFVAGALLYGGVAFHEEAFFRGFVLQLHRSAYGPMTGALVSAALFAAGHLIAPAYVDAWALTEVFLLGLLLAFMAAYYGSLWYPIGFHLAWNYSQTYLWPVQVAGSPVAGGVPAAVGSAVRFLATPGNPSWLRPDAGVSSPEMAVVLLLLAYYALRVLRTPQSAGRVGRQP